MHMTPRPSTPVYAPSVFLSEKVRFFQKIPYGLLLILMLTWHPASAVTTCQSRRIPLRYREQPNSRDDPCSITGNNITPLAAMTLSGSRARTRQPRHSSRRNGNPPSHRFRTACHRPSNPRGNRACWRSCRRHRSAARKLRHQSTPSPGPRVISRGRTMRASEPGWNTG